MHTTVSQKTEPYVIKLVLLDKERGGQGCAERQNERKMWENFDNENFFKILNKSEVRTDNTMIWLHRTVTVAILAIGSVILTLNNYVGDPIDCESNSCEKKNCYSDDYCWIYGTETRTGEWGIVQIGARDMEIVNYIAWCTS